MAMYNEPLGLPQGSVRAILTIILLLAVVGMAFSTYTNEFIVSLASVAVGYYFASRGAETTTTPRSESEVLVEPQVGKPEEEFTIVSGNQE
jgi:hypothetical protein